MIRRVSSRPRLVSDADRAFQNATVEEHDFDGYSSFDDVLNFDDDVYGDDGDGSDALSHGVPATNLDRERFDDPARHARPPDSLDDLSQFLSCHDLLELQDSFQRMVSFPPDGELSGGRKSAAVAIPSDESLEGRKPATAATSATLSSKRKRLSQSQHYLTPKSSFSSLYNAALSPLQYSPPTSVAMASQASAAAMGLHPSILDVAEENIVGIACYLPLWEVRMLASTCKTVRCTLVASRGATNAIWMGEMKEKFPSVFQRIDLADSQSASHSRTIAGALDVALGRVRAGSSVEQPYAKTNVNYGDVTFVDDYRLLIPGLSMMDKENANGNNVNLPLLAGLLPATYPQSIDPKTLRLFRSYTMSIDVSNGTALSQDDGGDDGDVAAAIVPVVEFTGRVGRGDRCIRSDAPFPPSCRKVSCDCTAPSGINRGIERSSVSSNFAVGLSSWMKTHVPHRRCSRKNRVSARSTAAANVVYPFSSMTAAHGHLAPPVFGGPILSHHPAIVASPSSTAMPLPVGRRSPMYHFLSRLSYPSTPASSSSFMGSDSADSTAHLMRGNSYNSENSAADECDVGNYGGVKHGLFKTCLGRMQRHRHKSSDGLRPFVVPTTISDERNEGGQLVVDVTPRLVAYFEVTILKQRPSRDRHAGDRPVAAVPLAHPIVEARGGGPQALRDYFIEQRRVEGELRNRRHARHECVAIGLSSSRFRTHEKMPGWDSHSYGYHGDDGGIFHGRGDMLCRYGPAFGPGDTVGCGLDYPTKRVFFAKNGEFLGWAFGEEDGIGKAMEEEGGGLYPTVGVDTECPVFVNCGEMPFVFNLRSFAGRITEEHGADKERSHLEGSMSRSIALRGIRMMGEP